MQPQKYKDPTWPLRVKTALFKKGMSVSDLATEIGKSRVAVSMAVNHGHNRPTCDLIATALKIAPPAITRSLWHAA